LGPGCVAAAVRGGFQRGAQVIDLGLHRGAVDLKHVAAGLQPGFKYGHGGWPLLCLLLLGEGAPKGRMRIRAKPGARKPMVTPARVLVPVQDVAKGEPVLRKLPLSCQGSGASTHGVRWNGSRPISMRRISEVPSPISFSLASRHRRPAGYSLM